MTIFSLTRLNKDTCQGQCFGSVNYLSSALVKENLLYFPLTLLRKTCQGELGSVYSRHVFLSKLKMTLKSLILLPKGLDSLTY